MSAQAEYVTMPVMRCVPALVIEPTDFLIPPPEGQTTIAVGAGPDPASANEGILYIGLQTSDGRLVTGLIPEKHLPALGELLAQAADRVRRLDFEKPEMGHG